MTQFELWMVILSAAGIIIPTFAFFVNAFRKISELNVRVTELEANLKEHKFENREDFREFIRENKEDHKTIFSKIDDIKEIIINKK